MMVYKVTIHYLCYPPQMGHQSVGLSSNRWTVQKSICGPFEKFHSMLISAIHGKLQSHNILSQEALASRHPQHISHLRCPNTVKWANGEENVNDLYKQSGRQTDIQTGTGTGTVQWQTGALWKDANVLMRTQDRTGQQSNTINRLANVICDDNRDYSTTTADHDD